MADLSDIGLKGLESYQTRALQAAQADQLQASAETQRFELKVAQRQQEVAQLAAAALNNADDDTTSVENGVKKLTSLADPLTNVGMIYLRSGLTEEGAKYLDKSSEIRRREVQNVSDEIKDQQNRLEIIQKGAEQVGTWLGKAQNQAEWDYGLDQLEAVLPEETARFRKMNDGKYSPDVAAFLRDKAISVLDQAKLDMDAAKERGIASRARAALANEDERIALQRKRDEVDANYKTALTKAAGSKTQTASAPSSEAVSEAKAALISGGYFKAPKANAKNFELEDAASYIAGAVAQELKDIPGLDRNSAIQRAIMRADAAGKFKTEPAVPSTFGIGGRERKDSFNRYSGEKRGTQELPETFTPKKTKPIVGNWYKLPDGSIGKYTEAGFEVP